MSIASFVSAQVGVTAAGVQGFDGDDTFTPELGTVLETLFDQVVSRRLQASNIAIGNEDDQILLEDGIKIDETLVLDGSCNCSKWYAC